MYLLLMKTTTNLIASNNRSHDIALDRAFLAAATTPAERFLSFGSNRAAARLNVRLAGQGNADAAEWLRAKGLGLDGKPA